MNCPACKSPETAVKDSRASGAGIRRRRECEACEARFSTMEIAKVELPHVLFPDGTLVPLDEAMGARLATSVMNTFVKACFDDPRVAPLPKPTPTVRRGRPLEPDPRCGQYEIEPGRSLPADIDEGLMETFVERKARLKAQREAASA